MIIYSKHFYTILVYFQVENKVYVNYFPRLLWDWKDLKKCCCFFGINSCFLMLHTLLTIILNS